MGSNPRRSKKPSESPSSPPKEAVFFIDRSLGSKVVPEALRSAGCHVELLKDHFQENEKDEVWIRAVSEKKWVILSKDKFIGNRLIVLQTVHALKGRMFVLTAGDMLGSEMGAVFKAVLNELVAVISTDKGPFIIKITQKGNLHRIDIETKLRKSGL